MLALLLSLSLGHAEMFVPYECEAAILGIEVPFAGRVKLPSGADVHVRVERPFGVSPAHWHVLTHGLLSSHRVWDRVAPRLVARGDGVVRMDLEGYDVDPDVDVPVPDVIPVERNARTVREVTEWGERNFGVTDPAIDGHSMGAAAVTTSLLDAKFAGRVHDAGLINPYVYRVDYYLAEKFGLLPLRRIKNLRGWLPFGMREAVTMYWDIMESLTDFYLTEPQMRDSFRRHFRKQIGERATGLSPAQLDRLTERQVAIAIATTKGLRDYDGTEVLRQIETPVPINLYYGSRDNLIEPALARRLQPLILRRGGVVKELKGGHMLPIEKPDDLVDLLERRGNLDTASVAR